MRMDLFQQALDTVGQPLSRIAEGLAAVNKNLSALVAQAEEANRLAYIKGEQDG